MFVAWNDSKQYYVCSAYSDALEYIEKGWAAKVLGEVSEPFIDINGIFEENMKLASQEHDDPKKMAIEWTQEDVANRIANYYKSLE